MNELIVVRAEECRPLRERVLRPGQPPAAWTYPDDDHARALHLAVKDGARVIGVASLLPEGRDGARETWRLRGMAVLEEHRRQGLGHMLLLAVQAVVNQRGGGLWCTARTGVEGFYVRHGFVRHGEPFEITGGGPHVVMTWNPRGRRRTAPVPEAEGALSEGGDAEGGEAGDVGEGVGGAVGGAPPSGDPDDEIVEHEDALPGEEPAAPPGED